VTKQLYELQIAAWNALDNAGANIRHDSNFTGIYYQGVDTGSSGSIGWVPYSGTVLRSGVTGDFNMKIQIYAIGYTGGGNAVDQLLLGRLANDPNYTNVYDATQPVGEYVPASSPGAIAAAFSEVASQLLRLSQ
jgi:hypothetical protein